jgi:hypothetical protein
LLIPWVTVYLGTNHALPFPVALYAAVSTAGAISFFLLSASIARHHHEAQCKRLHKKNGAQKPSRHSHLYRGHWGGVHLYAARLGHDRVAGNDVFPAGTRGRETRALERGATRLCFRNRLADKRHDEAIMAAAPHADHPSARVDADLMSNNGVPSNTSIGPIFTRVPVNRTHRHETQP